MASAEELRTAIDSSREALRRAIEDAAGTWEQAPPGDEEWSPRQAAEHVIGSELIFASLLAGIVDSSAPERRQFALASADEALAALSEVAGASGGVFASVADADLETPAPYMDDVAGVMRLVATHIDEHVQQIQGA
jgi:hypothetical protein